MTQQYQEESINGQPAPLSLNVTAPVVVPAAGLVNTSAVFWPSFAADAQIAGNGISVAGDASLGTIIEFSEPGLFQVNWTTSFAAPGPSGIPINILLGATLPVAGPTYPSLDFVGSPSPGVIAVSGAPFLFLPGPPTFLTAQFRITDAALVDPAGGVNPLRQMQFAAAALDIPLIFPPITQITIERQSR